MGVAQLVLKEFASIDDVLFVFAVAVAVAVAVVAIAVTVAIAVAVAVAYFTAFTAIVNINGICTLLSSSTSSPLRSQFRQRHRTGTW